MPNIASILKTEISRLARKELRSSTQASKNAIADYRRQIADMKQRIKALEGQVAKLSKQGTKARSPEPAKEEGPNLRFRAEGFARNRQRLGLSAKEMGLLLDASPLSVYKWEKGQAKPRAKHLQAIAALRTMGKREVTARLEELSAS